jgi:thiol-disulfide isomerase/thioredoxin
LAFHLYRPILMPSYSVRRVAPALLLIAVACRENRADTPALKAGVEAPGAVGTAAPAFTVAVLGGDSARVGGPATQPVTLVNIWATWCGPCKAEFPELQRLHTTYGPQGLRLLAVSIDSEDDGAVAASATAMGVTFPIARDPNDEIRGRFGAVGIPESWLIAADGTVLWRHAGAIPPGDTAVRSAIASALASGIRRSE